MVWLSPLITEGQRSQRSVKAEREFLDTALMPCDGNDAQLMVMNPLPPSGSAGTEWGGEGGLGAG